MSLHRRDESGSSWARVLRLVLVVSALLTFLCLLLTAAGGAAWFPQLFEIMSYMGM